MKQILMKFKEAAFSVAPIYFLIVVLCIFKVINMSFNEILIFTLSSFLLILGMALFNHGADISMTPMGKEAGSALTRKGRFLLLIVASFALGFLITIAEPDLNALALQTEKVFNKDLLITSIGLGVGVFLVLAILKTIFHVNLTQMISFSYMILFGVTILLVLNSKENIIALAFDSGGVTTGPITVPFLMALGLGVAKVVSSKKEKDASFGLVALCSVGPVIVVLLLSLFSDGNLSYKVQDYSLKDSFFLSFLKIFSEKFISVLISLLFIVVFFFICNLLVLKLSKQKLLKIGIGLIYTFLGLVLFLSAVEASYMLFGYKIGLELSKCPKHFVLMITFLLGSLTVIAEPAIHVLNEQVQEITGGLVKKKEMMIALTIGVGCAILLSVLRIYSHFNILYYLLPGYIVAIALSFFVPKIYSSIAFDSGGVASGPLTSTFILPMAIGLCYSISGEDEILTDAFGLVALVALTPIITIESLGLASIIKDKIKNRKVIKEILKQDDEIIIKFKKGGIKGE